MTNRKRIIAVVIAATMLSAAPTAARADVGTFTNATTITIPNVGQGSPYPSNITVAGLNGVITDVNATLVRINHVNPADIEALLVGPTGQTTMLIGDAGGSVDSVNDVITLDDQAQFVAPSMGGFVNGVSYRPQDYEMPGLDPFNAPAPAPPYGLTMSTSNGTNPNGTWSLYVFDDFFQMNTGDFNGGWSLQITTRILPTCQGQNATIEGTAGADTLTGTAGNDVIFADAGDDVIDGAGGDDTVCAGAGKDQAGGGDGNDTVLGEAGKDKLRGGRGKDLLLGGAGKDSLVGQGGKDTCKGGKATDTAKKCEVEKGI
jgi:Ca2+-binding RTX toxin-like protein